MTSAIIVAAGKGTRMGADRDKLFLEVGGKPVIAHTWDIFDRSPLIDEIVIVIRAGMEASFEQMATQYRFTKKVIFAHGGRERQDSVWNGLQALSPGSDVVAIQDGARPCTTSLLLEQCIRAAREFGAAVAAQRVIDTIKASEDGLTVSSHLDRSKLWAVQTPQTFRVPIILEALRTVKERGVVVTDDTAACELIGQSVRLVPCLTPNPKVTLQEDLPYIEFLLSRTNS
ncbi:MAG: 2-C-methyl-D-erythritol 4-phosphate cytidylyltransferase [Verrucomicrobiales bacterium]|nr:2-C-methyl-D-erythritol 4-phosphate cytidylyltransferase [Verrucomicrobiales bacterium]